MIVETERSDEEVLEVVQGSENIEVDGKIAEIEAGTMAVEIVADIDVNDRSHFNSRYLEYQSHNFRLR
jgi:hypothetical protein